MAVDTLPPWDTIPFFATPTERLVDLGNGATQIAQANPNRVAILFGAAFTGGTIFVTTIAPGAISGGLPIASNVPPLILTHHDVGPLVQMAWYSYGTLGQAVTVIEVILVKWPSMRSMCNAEQQADDAQRAERDG